MTLTWYSHFYRHGGVNQILKRQTSRFHYGSKVPAVITTTSTTTLEQNRQDSRQSKQYFNLKKKQKQKKTQISKLVLTTRFWNNLHQVRFWNNLHQVRFWNNLHLVRFWNNLHQVRSQSKDWTTKQFKRFVSMKT